MTKWILCFDGTWNDDHGEHGDRQTVTNVVRLYQNLASGSSQQKWYDKGVGTGFTDRIRGGMFGFGLDENIKQGYKWLAKRYNQDNGDQIFIFGFSRGAYTARSLAGMVHKCGLLKPQLVDDHEQDPGEEVIDQAYGLYRDKSVGYDSGKAKNFRKQNSREAAIDCLGVWDTVGALGIPNKIFLGDLDDSLYGFHDTTLNLHIRRAFHAVAIDEHRQEYQATLWSNPAVPGSFEQVWFAGAHADVGGGYHEHQLADISLAWMQEKAQGAGLTMLAPLADPPVTGKEPLHDSYALFMDGWYRRLCGGRRFFRTVDRDHLHDSVPLRCAANPMYVPPNLRPMPPVKSKGRR